MAPAQADVDDDPVTAEYDVYLTEPLVEQILLAQFVNRDRTQTYSSRTGTQTLAMRVKPISGHVEVDMNMHTGAHFNKLAGLRWQDALNTARDLHNRTSTFGAAAGFHPAKPRGVTARTILKDQADRENDIQNDLVSFYESEDQGKVLNKQIVGGQITRQDEAQDGCSPIYFIGAFKGDQLHLTKVDGTVQLRPQFHHLDAEDERTRLAASRAANADNEGPAAAVNPRSLLQRAKNETEGGRGRLEDRMRRLMQAAEAEEWEQMTYVDDEEDAAFDTFNDKLFVKDVAAAPRLKSVMDGNQYLDAIVPPRRESPTRARKRPPRKRQEVEDDDDVGEVV